MSLINDRLNAPWHAAFIHAIETFDIPKDRMLAVGEILEVFAVILETWEEHHIDERYWAGTGDDCLFGAFYNVLRDPEATNDDILYVSERIVCYLKSLVFMQIFFKFLTRDTPVPTFVNQSSAAWAQTVWDNGINTEWNTEIRPEVVSLFLDPSGAFNWGPVELRNNPGWHCLVTAVDAIRDLGLPDCGALLMTMMQLDEQVDLCLAHSGLGARFQWHLAMLLVGEGHSEEDTLARIDTDIRNVFPAATACAINQVRVRVPGFRPSPNPFFHGHPSAYLNDYEAAGGPQTLAHLIAYSRQLLNVVNNLRSLSLWTLYPGLLAMTFRHRLVQIL